MKESWKQEPTSKDKESRDEDWEDAFKAMINEQDVTWESNPEFDNISRERVSPEEIEKYIKDHHKELAPSQVQFLLARLRVLRNTK